MSIEIACKAQEIDTLKERNRLLEVTSSQLAEEFERRGEELVEVEKERRLLEIKVKL